MSNRITQSLGRALLITAAALFIQIGSAAAATPQGDIQQQMREVLSGSIATRASPRTESGPTDAARSNLDAQEFARQLLLGRSVSIVGNAKTTKQNLQADAFESSRKPRADEDFQSMVRRSLLGERASRGAL